MSNNTNVAASSNGEQPLTGIRKRQQIDSTRKQVLIWVGIAAAAVSVCLVVSINLIQRISYQGKVNGELSKTEKTMKSNVEAIKPLQDSVNKLKTNQQLNLQNLKGDDSTVFQVVIDALPTEDDQVSLGSSLQEKVLSRSGASMESLTFDTSGAAAATTTTTAETDSAASKTTAVVKPVAQPISFSVSLTGTVSALMQTLKDIENTIRPITITSISLEGRDDKLTANINATTYYSSKMEFKLGSKEIKP